MDMYPKYKSPFGYQVGDNGIDSYGVNHSGFSLRDEIEYQTARDQRESQLMQMYNQQGITDNYPQYTTNFWGDAGNNYGFGSSNISSAISAHPAMNTTPTPLQPVQTQMPQAQASSSWSDGYSRGIDNYQQAQMRGSFMSGVNNGYGGYTGSNGITGTTGSSFGSGSSFGASSSFGTTSGLQTQTPTPWSISATPRYTTSTPWRNSQTLTPWNGGYDLSNYGQNNGNSKSIDYSLYGDGFSKEFIDRMLNDLRFQQIMRNRTQRNEGGYSNHPNDKGGKTMYGISSKWYPNEDIENLTRERANAILYRDYWLKPHINQLPDEFADIVFDDGVVQGQPTAIINLQRALGIQADGIIGPNTLSAFENANYGTVRRNFIRNVNNVEDKYLQNDPSQKVFERGHRDRFNKY